MRNLILLFALAFTALAQTTEYTVSGNSQRFVNGFVPATLTVVTGSSVYVEEVTLSNETAGAVTVKMSDRSTDCNSGPCSPVPTISIPANTAIGYKQAAQFYPNGITWIAGAANSISVKLTYRTRLITP